MNKNQSTWRMALAVVALLFAATAAHAQTAVESITTTNQARFYRLIHGGAVD